MNDFKLFYQLSAEVDKNENVSAVYLKKPVIVGLVELNKDAELRYNPESTTCIRYFKLPKVQNYPLDLNLGIGNYVPRQNYNYKYKLQKVFRYLMDDHNDDIENNANERLDADKNEFGNIGKFDIVSHRGALALLLVTPLSTGIYNYGWTIYATYYNKKLYLNKTYGIDNETYNAVSTYHCKFVQYCFTDDPDQDPDTSAPIHEDEQTYCIYRSQLKNFNLIYSAEINGILSKKKLENVQNFNELNKCRFVHTKLLKKGIRDWRQNFRIQKWWAKSYFSAVNDIYVGFRSDLGFVDDKVEHVVLHELINKQQWSPKVCSTFLYRILTKIIEEVKDVNCPHTTYEFHFDSSRHCIEMKKHEGKTDKSFLTEEYIEYITKN